MNSWEAPLKKAVATFIFATSGALVGTPLLGVEFWKTAAAVGLGAVLNFVYRWSEAYLKGQPED